MRFFLVLLALAPLSAWAQGYGPSANAPFDRDYYHLLDRYEIRQGAFTTSYHTAFRPYQRADIALFLDSLSVEGRLSPADRFNLAYLRRDNWEYALQSISEDSISNEARRKFPILGKTFYKKRSDAYHAQGKGYDLHVNPVLYTQIGEASELEGRPFIFSRGIQVRGRLGNKLAFYTFLTENQARFPNYVGYFNQQNGAIYGEGFKKTLEDDSEVADFFSARGYILFEPIEYLSIQFGHDRNFLGNGYRSLMLDAESPDYLFLRLNTQVGRVQYTNLFAQMTADLAPGDNLNPGKFLTLHHLNINLAPNFSLGFFEAVTYSRADTAGNNNRIDLEYLNPVIFYRSVEHDLGSPDNVIIGLDFKWNLWNRLQLYGQGVIDEMVVSELTNDRGWWGNKLGGQLGFKYIDVLGVPNLDLQMELNAVRPYTYTHRGVGSTQATQQLTTQYANHQHYRQPLAHPMGANFVEGLAVIRYQPLKRLQLIGKVFYSVQGVDEPGQNLGSNIFLDYNTRDQEYSNELAQGFQQRRIQLEGTATYMLRHNLFLEGHISIRNLSDQPEGLDQPLESQLFAFAVRWNIPRRVFEF